MGGFRLGDDGLGGNGEYVAVGVEGVWGVASFSRYSESFCRSTLFKTGIQLGSLTLGESRTGLMYERLPAGSSIGAVSVAMSPQVSGSRSLCEELIRIQEFMSGASKVARRSTQEKSTQPHTHHIGSTSANPFWLWYLSVRKGLEASAGPMASVKASRGRVAGKAASSLHLSCRSTRLITEKSTGRSQRRSRKGKDDALDNLALHSGAWERDKRRRKG